MTNSYRVRQSVRTTAALMLACAAMLTACGGGGDDSPMSAAPTPGAGMATVGETVNSNLTADANGPATTTAADADQPGDPGTVDVLASDTSTPPSTTANDADAPGEPAASTV